MWINIQEQKPKGIGSAYTCYGTVNKGTEHETRTHFTAYWQGEEYGWSDKCGEDLIGINESVEYWFDFNQVDYPDIDDVGPDYVIILKPNYKSKDGHIKPGIFLEGKYYAPKSDLPN